MGRYRPRSMPVGDWLLERRVIDPATGCWEWPPVRGTGRYGYVAVNRQDRLVHRVAYELWLGPIPDEVVVCHTCDNPACFNPAHLFLGDDQTNAVDRERKGRGAYPHRRKVDPDLARAIASDARPPAAAAAAFGVSTKTVWNIRRGRTWGAATGIAPLPPQRRRRAVPAAPGPGAARGERHPKARLSAATVLAIIGDPRSNRSLAAALGVAPTTVASIRSGQNWSHVTGIQPKPGRPPTGRPSAAG